jgi:hypothetical protein
MRLSIRVYTCQTICKDRNYRCSRWKSTFIEAFGKYLTDLEKSTYWPVDPSSTIHMKYLGDKPRMEELVKDKMRLSVHQLQEKH